MNIHRSTCTFHYICTHMNRVVKDTIIQMNSWGKTKQAFFFMVDFKKENVVVAKPEDFTRENIQLWLSGHEQNTLQPEVPNFYFRKTPVEFVRYKTAFEKVIRSINHGDSFLTNLTFPTKIETNLSLDQIYHHSKAKYKLKYKDQFVVFSPETFITINGDVLSTFPMKGTMDASIENAEKLLMNDIKEVSEHNTIVDLMRNDLNIVSKKVRVEKFRYIERIKTHEGELLQTSSVIAGDLPENWRERIGDIIFNLLPAGSISGAPKKKTVEIIEDAEGYQRGWFTGVFGYFNGDKLDSAVMIRFIENINGQLYFKSGGGITHFSRCEQEYRELIEKVYVPIT